jgi:hypothetical protein
MLTALLLAQLRNVYQNYFDDYKIEQDITINYRFKLV